MPGMDKKTNILKIHVICIGYLKNKLEFQRENGFTQDTDFLQKVFKQVFFFIIFPD